MNNTARKTVILSLLLIAGLAARAQLYSNDFENQYTWYPPWANIVIAVDSSGLENNYVSFCDSTTEYGLGFDIPIHDTLKGNNLHLHFEADYRFPDTIGQGEIVFTIVKSQETLFWNSYPLNNYANDSAQWFHVGLDMNIPNDYLDGGGQIKSFLWNRSHSRVCIDNVRLALTPWTMPSFLPKIDTVLPSPTSHLLSLTSPLTPLTSPIGLAEEYIINGDTLTEYHLFEHQHDDLYMAASGIDTTLCTLTSHLSSLTSHLTSSFFKECKLLRQSIVIPFIDSTLIVYRKNMTVDSLLFQEEYYLDREGIKIGEGDRSVIAYHQNDISSIQLNAVNRTAWFNIDYWRDHPMIHYPLSDSIADYFEDISFRPITPGMTWDHSIHLTVGIDLNDLPRIMPIPKGYESGIIFTEHADWSDLRTHRATYYGSERITKPSKAIGGYVYYGIPVTKSVFYNNPDNITNYEVSHGVFPGLHATIKTDRAFEKFLKQLYRLGYDICLHTPEQYTTTPSNLAEAMRYMRRHFKSVCWIDHGYNNGSEHNREDLVCDGLTLTADLWRENGVKYLWNAYYEEKRMEQWCFDNNIIQPYPGFGDALPNRQVTEIVGTSQLSPLTSWFTPSTLDITSNDDWDYYYSDERLQRIVDNHCVHITHVYSPWVWPGRTFWTYDADSTIIAQPGMNRALERIATLRDERKMLPMTLKTYLDYYSSLRHVLYDIVDAEHISITNLGDDIKGFTLVCPKPIRFEDNRYYDFKKSGNEYYVWFDLKANDKVTIKINN